MRINIEKSWILYDVANSAWYLLAASLLPIYFNHLASDAGMSDAECMSIWMAGLTVSTILMLLVNPLLGALSDRKGMRRPLFMGTVVIGVLCCVVLGLPKAWLAFLVLFIIIRIIASATIVITDGMLIDVTTENRIDLVSAKGYAAGYIGSCIPFVLCLVLVIFSDYMDPNNYLISFSNAIAIGLIIVAIWWLVMSLPLFKNYEQKYYTKDGRAFNGIRSFKEVFRYVRAHPSLLMFLIAYFFYIDGVLTVMDLAAAYGEVLDLSAPGLLAALILCQIVGFFSTSIFVKLTDRIPPYTIMCVCIVGYCAISMYSVVLSTTAGFFIVAVGVGLFQGTIQALSRSHLCKMIPRDMSGSMFGFMDVFNKCASIMGTSLIAVATMFTGEVRVAGVILSILFIVGLILFIWSIRMAGTEGLQGEIA